MFFQQTFSRLPHKQNIFIAVKIDGNIANKKNIYIGVVYKHLIAKRSN